MFLPDDPMVMSGWESFCYAIPFILLGMVALFRLDGLFASPARRSGKLTALPGTNSRGQPELRDPDGSRF
jgi:hypothetical protein